MCDYDWLGWIFVCSDVHAAMGGGTWLPQTGRAGMGFPIHNLQTDADVWCHQTSGWVSHLATAHRIGGAYFFERLVIFTRLILARF